MTNQRAKKRLRKEFLEKRLQLQRLDHEKLSSQIVENLAQWLVAKDFDKIFYYWPHKGEANILSLPSVLDKGFEFSLPIVKPDKRMEFYCWEKGDSLQKNCFGINEPCPRKESHRVPDKKTLIIVPSLALDPSGTRLGFGGGFYDRYFSRYPRASKLGVVFSFQFVKNLPKEEKDVRVNYIVTENKRFLISL